MHASWKLWLLLLCVSFIKLSALHAQDRKVPVLSTDVQLEPIDLPMLDSVAKVSQIRVMADLENSPTGLQ